MSCSTARSSSSPAAPAARAPPRSRRWPRGRARRSSHRRARRGGRGARQGARPRTASASSTRTSTSRDARRLGASSPTGCAPSTAGWTRLVNNAGVAARERLPARRPGRLAPDLRHQRHRPAARHPGARPADAAGLVDRQHLLGRGDGRPRRRGVHLQQVGAARPDPYGVAGARAPRHPGQRRDARPGRHPADGVGLAGVPRRRAGRDPARAGSACRPTSRRRSSSWCRTTSAYNNGAEIVIDGGLTAHVSHKGIADATRPARHEARPIRRVERHQVGRGGRRGRGSSRCRTASPSATSSQLGLERALEIGAAGAARAAGSARRRDLLSCPTSRASVRDFVTFESHVEGVRRSIDNAVGIPEAWYDAPTFYFTNPHALYGPGQPVPQPVLCRALDFEMEVGVVLGRGGTSLTEARGARTRSSATRSSTTGRPATSRRARCRSASAPPRARTSPPRSAPGSSPPTSSAVHDADGFLDLDCRAYVNGELDRPRPAVPHALDVPADDRLRLARLGRARRRPAGLGHDRVAAAASPSSGAATATRRHRRSSPATRCASRCRGWGPWSARPRADRDRRIRPGLSGPAGLPAARAPVAEQPAGSPGRAPRRPGASRGGGGPTGPSRQ